jgi:hypothetical protein
VCSRLLTCIGFQLNNGSKLPATCWAASAQRSFSKIATGT